MCLGKIDCKRTQVTSSCCVQDIGKVYSYTWLWYCPKLIKVDAAGRKEVAAHTPLDSHRRGHLEISSTELIKVLKVLGHKSSYGHADLISMCMLHVICLPISKV